MKLVGGRGRCGLGVGKYLGTEWVLEKLERLLFDIRRCPG